MASREWILWLSGNFVYYIFYYSLSIAIYNIVSVLNYYCMTSYYTLRLSQLLVRSLTYACTSTSNLYVIDIAW